MTLRGSWQWPSNEGAFPLYNSGEIQTQIHFYSKNQEFHSMNGAAGGAGYYYGGFYDNVLVCYREADGAPLIWTDEAYRSFIIVGTQEEPEGSLIFSQIRNSAECLADVSITLAEQDSYYPISGAILSQIGELLNKYQVADNKISLEELPGKIEELASNGFNNIISVSQGTPGVYDITNLTDRQIVIYGKTRVVGEQNWTAVDKLLEVDPNNQALYWANGDQTICTQLVITRVEII